MTRTISASPWPRLGIALAILFVAASVWLVVTIYQVRGDLTAVVRSVDRVASVEEAIRELHECASAGNMEDGPRSGPIWFEAAEALSPAIESLATLRDLEGQGEIGDELSEAVDELLELRGELLYASAIGEPPSEFLRRTDRAHDLLAGYTRVLRREIASISGRLWHRWQLVLGFLLASCVLAIHSAWLLQRNHRQLVNLRMARTALVESQRRLRTVISNAPVVLFAMDAEGVFTLSKGKGLAALGLREGEIVGRSVFDLTGDVPVAAAYSRRALAGESFTGTVDLEQASLQVSYVPSRNEEGEVTGVLGCATDVTELRGAQEALRRSEEARQESQRIEAVGRLAGGIAHEFSNLLTIIGGFGSLIQDSLGARHGCSADVERVLKAADQAAKLTHDLLAFSRHHAVEPEVRDMNELVEEAARMLAPVLGERVFVETRLHRSALPICVDPGRFEQVVVNLALNARDAMPDGGRVVLETRRISIEGYGDTSPPAGDYACLRVIDEGFGMSAEVREHAFEPFFTTKDRGRGTGLGLATCHGIVGQAGGSIRVESAPEAGTTVEVLLPESAPAPALPARDGPAEGVPAGGAETVLLAEDNPMVRSFAARVLRELGYVVHEAEDGEQALARARGLRGSLDLLVSDVVMPGIGGTELARRLRTQFPDLRVLFVSGYSGAEPLSPADHGEHVHFLAKPFSPEELGRRVRSLLDQREGHRMASKMPAI